MGVPTENADLLIEAQQHLRQRLCGAVLPNKIHGYTTERSQLLDIIKRSAVFSESNSILVVGPRGSGKSMLLKSVVEELTEDKEIQQNLLQVHLNGLLQTDDRIALKEITRQLQLENTVGDKVFGSFAENLQFLLDALKSGGKETKSVIFVLEEFDLFAHHKNQTLLYNLFDVAQSSQAPICVVGLTARLDVTELLEKRVKSRFSHRQLHLLPQFTFTEYTDMFVDLLSLPASFVDQRFAKEWNKHIQNLSQDASVMDVLRRQHQLNQDVRALQQMLMIPVCKLDASHNTPEASDIIDASKVLSMDSKAAMLHGVSILELSLIIAMMHLGQIYDGEPFNFEMVYKEYVKFGQKRSSLQVFEKPVVLKAFEHLCSLELVQGVTGGATKAQKEYRPMELLVNDSQIMEALQKYPSCPTEVKQWASTSVV